MRNPDVIVAGAGPAGAVAALILARGGARVLMLDRSTFPRDKLCGDTLNPGALALLDELRLTRDWESESVVLRGMRVTGPGASIEARYGGAVSGRAIRRRAFDEWLLRMAIVAGAECETSVTVLAARLSTSFAGTACEGLDVRLPSGARTTLRAGLTIAADGRRSPTALSARLLRHPTSPRRWAFGTYAAGVSGMGDLGEMHVEPGCYIGMAPMGGGVVNICVVTSRPTLARRPLDLIRAALAGHPRLRDRIRDVRFDAPVHVLGPLAVDVPVPGLPGLLLAGDAAGFVDPMTGDGLHLAMRGGILAAEAALAALQSGDLSRAVSDLSERRRILQPKLRFNRLLRMLVESPIGIQTVGYAAAYAPSALRYLVKRAGDAA